MYVPNNPLRVKTVPFVTLAKRSLWRRCFLFSAVALALGWFALSPTARAVTPAPDGGYANSNTAEGEDALFSLTAGFGNSAIGYHALYSNTIGTGNTATGIAALFSNTTGSGNTAYGDSALELNNGSFNTAIGAGALTVNAG